MTDVALFSTTNNAFHNGKLIVPEHRSYEPGRVQGLHLTIGIDTLEMILRKFEAWFDERDEVILVDSGTSLKQQTGFVLLEWEDYEIDPLFLAILNDEEIILDVCLYSSTAREG